MFQNRHFHISRGVPSLNSGSEGHICLAGGVCVLVFSPKMTDKPEALQGPLLDTGAQQMPGLIESEHAALVWLWKGAVTHSQV